MASSETGVQAMQFSQLLAIKQSQYELHRRSLLEVRTEL